MACFTVRLVVSGPGEKRRKSFDGGSAGRFHLFMEERMKGNCESGVDAALSSGEERDSCRTGAMQRKFHAVGIRR